MGRNVRTLPSWAENAGEVRGAGIEHLEKMLRNMTRKEGGEGKEEAGEEELSTKSGSAIHIMNALTTK